MILLFIGIAKKHFTALASLPMRVDDTQCEFVRLRKFWGDHISRGSEFDAFLTLLCFVCFSGGYGILERGKFHPKEIAGINTGLH